MIQVLEDVFGTKISAARVAGSRVAIDILREPITRADWSSHDYNLHFSFGLQNRSDVDVVAEVEIENGRWQELPNRAPLLFTAADRNGPYTRAQLEARTDFGKRYAIRVPLGPRQKIYLANTLVRDPTAIEAACQDAALASGASAEVYGRSVRGQELRAYHFPSVDAPATILITSGFHQAEADTLATESIMRWLGSAAAASVRDRYNFVVVPIVNPDGFILGTQGSNAVGVNLYWWFAWNDPQRCPEAAALWSLANRVAPVGYVDFHGYTIQLHKEAGPYLKPVRYYRSATARRAATYLEDRVSHLGVQPVRGFGTIAPHTLGTMLTTRFDTLTMAKYHLHLKHGVGHYREHAVVVVETLAEALSSAGSGPVGERAEPRARLAMRNLHAAWAGFVRPALGRMRRGRFDMNFTRNAIIPPDAPSAQEIN